MSFVARLFGSAPKPLPEPPKPIAQTGEWDGVVVLSEKTDAGRFENLEKQKIAFEQMYAKAYESGNFLTKILAWGSFNISYWLSGVEPEQTRLYQIARKEVQTHFVRQIEFFINNKKAENCQELLRSVEEAPDLSRTLKYRVLTQLDGNGYQPIMIKYFQELAQKNIGPIAEKIIVKLDLKNRQISCITRCRIRLDDGEFEPFVYTDTLLLNVDSFQYHIKRTVEPAPRYNLL